MTPARDDALRLVALGSLVIEAPPLAREALECGELEIQPNVLSWTGSLGDIAGHRVVLRLDAELRDRVLAAPAVVDVLTAAIAAAVRASSGGTLAELEIAAGKGPRAPRSPYRG
jgi:hypothetical protein